MLTAGPVGILLIHGYTGAPPEMRLLGDYLHQRGLTVAAPLLPGHGATPDDLNLTRWPTWAAHVEQSLADLRVRCQTVFVGGLSLGSLLTLNLAADHPELPGIVAYSPAVWLANRLIWLTPIAKRLLPMRPKSTKTDHVDPQTDARLWCYEVDPVWAAHEVLKLALRVRRRLPRVTSPLLVVHSTGDHEIHPRSALRTYQQAGSSDKELVTLERSGHCVTVDACWEEVAARTYGFIRAHSSLPH